MTISIIGCYSISDHSAVLCGVQLQKPYQFVIRLSAAATRAWTRNSSQDLEEYNLAAPESTDVATAVEHYNHTLASLLDTHAPKKQRSIIIRPDTPWYNNIIREQKQLRRRLERRWIQTRLEADHHLYCEQRQHVTALVRSAKREHYFGKIAESSRDLKQLFKIVNNLIEQAQDQTLPSSDSTQFLVDRFSDFFDEKIQTIHASLGSECATDSPTVPIAPATHSHSLSSFAPATPEEIIKLVKAAPTTSCELDPFPTWLLKDCIETLAPAMCNIVNMSLESGVMPSELKTAHLKPLLKKISLDPDDLKNYRPVSNLTFLSKVVERIVSSRLHTYLEESDLHTTFQSAYKRNQSVESALTTNPCAGRPVACHG